MTADPVIVVVPPVEITEATLPAFERELMGYLDGHAGGLVVDLASVGFISSAGLGTLVRVGMRLDSRGRRLAFARAQGPAEHTLTLLGLDRMMPLFPTVEAASAHVVAHAGPKRG